jgi:hypothetical protein
MCKCLGHKCIFARATSRAYKWMVITFLHPHFRASQRYQCNINIADIHFCFMEYKNRSINDMQLSYLSFHIPTRILNGEGMSFLTFV